MENIWKKTRANLAQSVNSYHKILEEQIGYMNEDIKGIALWGTVVTVSDSESKYLSHAVHILPIHGDGYSYRLLELKEIIGQKEAILTTFTNPVEDQIEINSDAELATAIEKIFSSERMTIVINQLISINNEYNKE